MLEFYSNNGYINFKLQIVKKRNRKQNNQINNSPFNQQINIPNIQDNINTDNKEQNEMILFLTMIPAKETKQIQTDNSKRILNATVLDRDKKQTISIKLDEIIAILDLIQQITNTGNTKLNVTLFRDKAEKNIMISFYNNNIYFSNKQLNVSVGVNKDVLKRYLEKVIDYMLDFNIRQDLEVEIIENVRYS